MDRKRLTRAYKDTRRPMGVFRIRNTANKKSLIGSSIDLPAVLNRQRFQLEAGVHPNLLLQQDWRTLGPAAFEFEILDTLEPPDKGDYDPTEDLRALREMWLERLEALGESEYAASSHGQAK